MMVYLDAQVTDAIDGIAVNTNTKWIDGSFSRMN